MLEQSPYEGAFDRTGKICLGRIVNTDPAGRTVRAKTIGMGMLDDLDLTVVHVLHRLWHAEGDEDVAMPRRGAIGLIAFVGTEPVWIGSIPSLMASGNLQRNNQDVLNQGDIISKTSFGNKIVLRTGGTIEIQSTPLCRTLYIPSQNLIASISQNYEVETSGGYLKWNISQEENEDNPATKLTLKAWNNLRPDNAVILDVGTVTEENNEEAASSITPFDAADLILDLRQGSLNQETQRFEKRSLRVSVKKDGSLFLDVGPGKMSMKIDAASGNIELFTSGSVSAKVEKDVTLDVKGAVKATVAKDITIDAKQKVTANVTGDFSANVKGKATISADGAATVSSKAAVTVDAGGKATINAKSGADIKSDGPVKVEGQMVTVEGKSMVNVNGQMVNLAGGGVPVARVGDTAVGSNGGGPLVATILKGSPKVTSG